MKILHVNSAENWRGGEQQVAYLTEGLKIKNIDQLVFCRQNSAFAHFCKEKDIPFLSFRPQNPLGIAFQLKKICLQEKIALMHFHDSTMHTCAVLAADLFRNPTPFVVSRRVDYPVKKNIFSRWKYNHPKLKKILCVSETIRRMYLADIKNPKKLITVYSGIELEKFKYPASGILRREFQIASDTLLIGNVAAISPHKDYYTFVNTVEILYKQGLEARYLIIGSEDDLEESQKIKTYIREKNLDNQIILTGFRRDIPQILPELDIFLFTSQTEGLGTSLLDAFACKVPVVATKAGGIPELVIHEKTGLLSPVKDANDLAQNVLRLVRTASLRSEIVAGACVHLQNFSKEKTLENTLRIYKECIS